VALINGLIWGGVMGLIAMLLYKQVSLGLVMVLAMTLNLLLAAVMGVLISMTMMKLGRGGRLALDDQPFGRWLAEHGQSEPLVRKLYDPLLTGSLNEDCRWHREWSQALVRIVIADNPDNAHTIQVWIEKWYQLAVGALQAFAPLFEGNSQDAFMAPLEGLSQKLDTYHRDYLSAVGLQHPTRETHVS